VGCNVLSVGVVPTPAVAYLVGKYECEAGIMISASHNPCEYNGIKIFQKTGYKLDDAIEEEIEAIILDGSETPSYKIGGEVGNRLFSKNAIKDYIDHVVSTTEVRFDGMKIALDCANGSASVCAKDIFTALGAKCIMLSDTPDGTNINENCGSTHPEELMHFVKTASLDLGLAFDGDADRMLAVDENGELVDGDKIMFICGKYRDQQGKLSDHTIVSTVMSNLGFRKACERDGLKTVATAVGDRNVFEEMVQNGYDLGGEQSGHIIFMKHATTGDGILTSLMLMGTMIETKRSLGSLADEMEVYPQVLKNVRVTDKDMAEENPAVQAAVRAAEEELGEDGRILVRPSGTEPLIRVMVEAASAEICEKYVKSVVDVIISEGLAAE
jgi:phosphoglucosamine mutase